MSATGAVPPELEATFRPVGVHVRFAPSEGPRLRRVEPTTCADGQPLWVERPLVMERADGSYDLIGTSTHLAGLARWVLSHGADAEVKGPARLRRRVVAEARQIVNLYEDDPA